MMKTTMKMSTRFTYFAARCAALLLLASASTVSHAYRNGLFWNTFGPGGSGGPQICFQGFGFSNGAWVPVGGITCWDNEGQTVGGGGVLTGVGVFNGPVGPTLGQVTSGVGAPTLFGWYPGEMLSLGRSESGHHYLTLADSGNVLRRMRVDVAGSLETIGAGAQMIQDLDEDLTGRLWGVSSSSLFQIDKATGAQTVVAALTINAVGVAVNGNGNLWIADAHAVYDFDLTTHSMTQFMTSEREFTDLGSSAVPEPATLAGIAVGGLGLLARRKRRK